jgi:hypothetical protein
MTARQTWDSACAGMTGLATALRQFEMPNAIFAQSAKENFGGVLQSMLIQTNPKLM